MTLDHLICRLTLTAAAGSAADLLCELPNQEDAQGRPGAGIGQDSRPQLIAGRCHLCIYGVQNGTVARCRVGSGPASSIDAVG